MFTLKDIKGAVVEKKDHAVIDGVTPEGFGPHRFLQGDYEYMKDFVKRDNSNIPFCVGIIHCSKCKEDRIHNQAIDAQSSVKLRFNREKLAIVLYEDIESLSGLMPEWSKASTGKRDYYLQRADAIIAADKDIIEVEPSTAPEKSPAPQTATTKGKSHDH